MIFYGERGKRRLQKIFVWEGLRFWRKMQVLFFCVLSLSLSDFDRYHHDPQRAGPCKNGMACMFKKHCKYRHGDPYEKNISSLTVTQNGAWNSKGNKKVFVFILLSMYFVAILYRCLSKWRRSGTLLCYHVLFSFCVN